MGAGPEARYTRTWGDEGIYDHQLVYDVEARRTVVTNSLGYATTYIGNENGLVVEVHDARGGVTLTEYNEYNDTLSQTDQLGHITTYFYDERSNCTQVQLPNGTQIHRTYDTHDRLTSLIDRGGNLQSWQYDACGNVTIHTDILGLTTTYLYEKGLLRELGSATGQKIAFAYDVSANVTA
ncbi:MAG: hypothetical protein EOO61_08735, partial [Hymenobacter sp.]